MESVRGLASQVIESNVGLAAVGICSTIGAYKICQGVSTFMGGIARHKLRRPYKHFERYAKEDSWVIVTGGSDGIGFEICNQMAEQGFNVCIVSRTLQKIETRCEELKLKFPKLKTRAVAFDFGKNFSIADYAKIAAAVADLDIAMLFLNAGTINVGAFKDLTNDDIESNVLINAAHPIYMMKVLIDQMLARNHLSAMVVTSSGLGSMAVPGCTDYSCSKSFASLLAEGLNYELKGKIDCLAWQSGKVATKMNGDEADSGHCVTPSVAVKGMLRDVGKESLTYGCTPHAKSMFVVGLMPYSKIQALFYKGFCEDRLKQIEMKKRQGEK